MFKNWLNSGSQKGYNSYGNGSAMRVSYIGWHFDTLEAVEGQAARSSTCTHDHPEGIRAAQATAGAVFWPAQAPRNGTWPGISASGSSTGQQAPGVLPPLWQI